MFHLLTLLILTAANPQQDAVTAEVPLERGTRVRFATVEEGGHVLATRDEFIAAMSPFDRALRLKSNTDATEDRLLKYLPTEVLAWQKEEIEKLSPIIKSLGRKIRSLRLRLPKTVLLIKTTGNEESGAAYCRSHAIVLPQRVLARPDNVLGGLLAHELFHVLTTHDPELREALYEMLGFRRSNDIELPENLKSRKITNPDAPKIDHYIEVTFQGEPIHVTPILFSSEETYSKEKGDSIFGYLTFKLMAVEKAGTKWVPRHVDGEPWLLAESEVEGFKEQIGENTGYIIHPEEVLADNFGLLVAGRKDLPSPEIIEKMKKVIARHARGKPRPR